MLVHPSHVVAPPRESEAVGCRPIDECSGGDSRSCTERAARCTEVGREVEHRTIISIIKHVKPWRAACLGSLVRDVHAYSTKMAKSVFMGRLASANTIPCKVLLNPRESVPSLWRRISATSPMMSSCAHGFTRQAQVGETSCRGQHS
jgi:hypothetical protein